MTAEEYLHNHTVGGVRENTILVTNKDAKIAIEMARKEEREKAINAFDEVTSDMTYHIARGEDYSGYIEKFKNLLNK